MKHTNSKPQDTSVVTGKDKTKISLSPSRKRLLVLLIILVVIVAGYLVYRNSKSDNQSDDAQIEGTTEIYATPPPDANAPPAVPSASTPIGSQ